MGSGGELHSVLRRLWFDTDWNYAVLWKLRHRPRMVLTLEDAYYDNCERYNDSGDRSLNETMEASRDPQDPLGLVLAKMSYQVYALGEGIVGQVAITGMHQWISADNIVKDICSPSEYYDGWQSQFLAGIRTILVVPVVPHGVVQLGSLKKITENVKLVSHVKDAFMARNSPAHVHSSINSSLCEAISSENLASGASSPVCLQNLNKAIDRGKSDLRLSAFPKSGKDGDSSYILPVTGNFKNAPEVVIKHGELESFNIGGYESSKLHQSKSSIFNLENSKLVGVELLDSMNCTGESSGCKDTRISSTNSAYLLSNVSDRVELSSTFINSTTNDKANLDSLDLYHKEMLHASEHPDIKFQSNLDNLKFQTELGQGDTSSSSLMFPAGCELHEALGPAFTNKNNFFDWEAEKSADKSKTATKMPEGMNSSQLTSDSSPEHLLEAVVAKVCNSSGHVKSEKSFCKSMQSLLTSEKYPETSSHTTYALDSENYSIDQPSMRGEEDIQQGLSSSGICGVLSPIWFSSPCPSSCSEQQERLSGPAKNNKKRARPGETSRPRPRDRQLIQDRIKELRELTPNGGKCSIDSLLERTIKHMLFLQSITKHADKLNKCADAKFCPEETNMPGSANYERGSSWAVEVGGNLKVCSIVVDNLNKSDQMVVEMMCEECSHFLEIAEAIRSLGLTILKGVTEARGDKTWICFIVEGQNNRNIHRMDILWSLVQILQPKNPVQQQS